MKIFIGGSRGIKTLDENVYNCLVAFYKSSIYKIYETGKGDEVLIGDAEGVDILVQEFYHKLKRSSVTVFACEGKARHNAGGWKVENIAVESTVKDFSYYSQKDKAMAKAADCGFMIWNGKSKGTLCNIINLIQLNKPVTVYFTPTKELFSIKNIKELTDLIKMCCENTQSMYVNMMRKGRFEGKI